MANLKIMIEGDTNDADYISEINDITKEQLNSIMPIIEAVKNCTNRHNWASEYANYTIEDLYPQFFINGDESPEMETFYEFLPHGEYGIHSIDKIVVLEIVKETRLL
jgi:hypothetical protein